jgi:hypothetical protein
VTVNAVRALAQRGATLRRFCRPRLDRRDPPRLHPPGQRPAPTPVAPSRSRGGRTPGGGTNHNEHAKPAHPAGPEPGKIGSAVLRSRESTCPATRKYQVKRA